MRLRLAPLMLAVALVISTPAAMAAGASGPNCDRFHAESVPFLHPAIDVGHVELCDEDDDEIVDTIRFDTDKVHSDGVVSVTSEEKRRADHRDDETQAKARFSPSAPLDPVLYQRVQVDDDRDDGQIDAVRSEGGVYTDVEDSFYLFRLRDLNDDGQFDAYGLLICNPNGCEAPGPRDIPDIPRRIDLPDVVLRVDHVGFVP